MTLTQDLICTAQFELRQETLVVEKQGAGNVNDLLGIDCGEVCQANYPTGTVVTLVATSAENSVFQSWQDECGQSNENTTMITLDTSKICTAIFIPKSENAIPNQETLMIATTKGEVTVTTAETLSCQDSCTYHYPKDTLITLEAKADEGYRLVQWQGDCGESNDSLITITLNSSKTCSVQFEQLAEQVPATEAYRLQVIVQGLGQVTSEPTGINCWSDNQQECNYTSTVATTVKLTASPINDSEFTGWEGDCQSQETTLLVPMLGSKVCVARFEPVKRIEFTQSSWLVTEFGEESTLDKRGHFITLPINKSGDDLVTVHWQAIDGTAKLNEDYMVISSSTLTGATGEQLQGIKVFIIDDAIPEADETFKIALSPLGGSTQLGTVNQVEVVIQDDDKTTACTLPLQPARQTVSLWQGESKVVTLSGGSGQRYVEENFNHSLVTVTPLFPNTGDAKLILTPQHVGETQLTVKDECGNEAVLEVSVQERSPLPDNSCIPDPKLVWQPAEQSITLFIGEEPRIYWLTGGQGQRQLVQAPDAQIVNLEQIEFPATAGAQLTLSSRQVEGTTTLVVSDCAGHQAVMNLNIVKPDNQEVCQALQPQQQHISLLTDSQPITLSFNGSQVGLDLVQLPNPLTVTLETLKTLSSNLTQLVLSPRDPGQTQLELDNCAHQPVLVDITVLKPNTLAYFCELDHRHDELCINPDETRNIYANGMAVDATGESIDLPVNWQTQLLVNSQQLDEIPIVSVADKLTVQVTTISEQLNYQPAELIVLLEHQGQFYFPTVDILTSTTNIEETNEFSTPTRVNSKWSQWNERWADLRHVKLINHLATIHEETFTFKLLPDLNGDLTLYIGYRLEDGRLVFNGHRPLRLVGANGLIFSSLGEYQDSRAYFNVQVQKEGEQIDVRTQIYPAPEHLYQLADLIMVAIYFAPEGKVLNFSRSANQQWQPWDGQLSTLEIAETNVLLTGPIETEVFSGNLNYLVGTINLYLGYRQLLGDTLIFNGKAPMVLTLP
ncbi:MAG: hypothetical protein HC877_04970 [Thioploca sp.]|nr:hypothetical protein [Thioploca sp.]